MQLYINLYFINKIKTFIFLIINLTSNHRFRHIYKYLKCEPLLTAIAFGQVASAACSSLYFP